MENKTAFITGISSGLGEALALNYLDSGWNVIGLSRRNPKWGYEKENLHFQSVNLAKFDEIERNLEGLFEHTKSIDIAILNAAILGEISDLAEADLTEVKKIMDVNVWANKIIFDFFIHSKINVKQIVAISSGASKSGGRGWNGYGISKAALNMLVQLYASEMPETHITALAPGLIDSSMQEYISSLSHDTAEKFPTVKRLKEARGTNDMPKPKEAAKKIISFLPKLLTMPSGKYYDIRDFK
ncbi:MAG: SDR family NAD(P)-dependent oxidoreductase [Spirochaetia bacterium]|nr:SDR family NAD(P)-dependent oxidoreductase [Spirochaetia bacterium]